MKDASVMEPPLGQGRFLLGDVRRFARQNNGLAFPLSGQRDRHRAKLCLEGGFLHQENGDRHFVRLTPKGEAYLDNIMRCE